MKLKTLAVATTMLFSLCCATATEVTTSINKKVEPEKKMAPKTSYKEFKKNYPEISKYEKHPEFLFDSILTVEALSKKDYYLDTDAVVSDKYLFYRYVKPQVVFEKIAVNSKSIIVDKKTNKISGFIFDFSGEKTKDEIVNLFKSKFGDPLAFSQKNTEILITWGYEDSVGKTEDRNKIVPVAVSFDIYQDSGAVIWGSPSTFFTN